jgi:hypothetical protein
MNLTTLERAHRSIPLNNFSNVARLLNSGPDVLKSGIVHHTFPPQVNQKLSRAAQDFRAVRTYTIIARDIWPQFRFDSCRRLAARAQVMQHFISLLPRVIRVSTLVVSLYSYFLRRKLGKNVPTFMRLLAGYPRILQLHEETVNGPWKSCS